MSKVSIPTVIIGLLVILILAVYAFTYQVAFYEAAVKVRLGKADESSVITNPGLHFQWIWPIERITRYDTRLRVMDTPETEIKTQDGKAVIVGSYAVWRIDKPLQFYNRVRTVAEAERQMRDRLSTAQAAVIGRRGLSDFVNLDRAALEASYDALLTEIVARKTVGEDGQNQPSFKEGMLTDFGIAIEQVGIRRISLPQEVTQEVFKTMIQERKTLAARYREEGKSRAEAIKARAESDARQILSFTETKAQEIKSAGMQASAEILRQINETDRELFEWLRWLEALKATLKQRTTIFLDQDSPLFGPFVNPPVPAAGAAGQ